MNNKQQINIQNRIIFGVIAVLALIRLIFIVKTGIYTQGMQNDVGTLDASRNGHLGYIYYLAYGGDVIHNDAAVNYQFYHPPLHYMIAALWLRIVMLFGMSLKMAGESLQFLTLAYSIASLIFVDKIVKIMNGGFKARIIALVMAGLFPYSIIMAGSVNNDGLVTLLMLITIWYMLEYSEKQDLKTAFKTGIFFGLAIMTKTSALTLGPGILVFMLYQYYRNKKSRMKYIDHYIVFGLVSSVIGLWYPLKNHIIYKMPFLYVPRLGNNINQYIGGYGLVERLFDFTGGWWKTPGVVFDEKNVDYNIFTTFSKFGMFAESKYYEGSKIKEEFFKVLLCIFMIVIVLSFICALLWLAGEIRHGNRQVGIMLAVMYVTIIISYIRFCIAYPHVCTMHVRYVMVAVFMTAVFSGLYIEKINKKSRQ